MLSALQIIKNQIKSARDVFEGTAADISEAHINVDPGGKAFPLGATYAHLIFSEDVIVNSMIQGKTPLFADMWRDKTGASTPMPAMDADWEKNNEAWSKSVKINMVAMRDYAKAVYAATDAYVASLVDADLEKEIDLGAWGKKTLADMLLGFVAGHTFSLGGELAALKGVHGFKGYPF